MVLTPNFKRSCGTCHKISKYVNLLRAQITKPKVDYAAVINLADDDDDCTNNKKQKVLAVQSSNLRSGKDDSTPTETSTLLASLSLPSFSPMPIRRYYDDVENEA